MTAKNYDIKTHTDAIIYFITQLDLDMINKLLQKDRLYLGYVKAEFILNLNTLFEKFLLANDTTLVKHPGFCNSEHCNKKCKGFSFVGSRSDFYIDLIFEQKEDGVLEDFTECRNFKNNSRKFQTQKRQFIKLYIAPDGDIPF